MNNIDNIDKLRSFFSSPNKLRLWKRGSLFDMVLTIYGKCNIDITCERNLVYTIYTKGESAESEETICKLCMLIMNLFPLHFQYDCSTNNYILL